MWGIEFQTQKIWGVYKFCPKWGVSAGCNPLRVQSWTYRHVQVWTKWCLHPWGLHPPFQQKMFISLSIVYCEVQPTIQNYPTRHHILYRPPHNVASVRADKWMDERMDNVKTVYNPPSPTNTVCRRYNKFQ